MRELAILTFTTLDGVVQAPKLPDEDRSGGFSQGGWADPHWDPVMEQVGREAMAGKRLFEPGGRPRTLNLVKSEAGPTGVVMAIYRR